MKLLRKSLRRILFAQALLLLPSVSGAVELISFSSPSAQLALGSAVTEPPLLMLLDAPASFDTFIPVFSSDDAILAIVGGGVTVPTGSASGSVEFLGFSTGTVSLAASFGTQTVFSTVTVVSATPPIPEPSTLMLLSMGGVALAALRRRSRSC